MLAQPGSSTASRLPPIPRRRPGGAPMRGFTVALINLLPGRARLQPPMRIVLAVGPGLPAAPDAARYGMIEGDPRPAARPYAGGNCRAIRRGA